MPDTYDDISEAPQPDKATIARRVAFEDERRARLGVPAAVGGVLYLLSGVILNASLRGLPTVGTLQGLAPALRGEANPAVSPRAGEVRFVSHHAFGLIAGSALQAMALGLIVVVLLFLLDAVRFRQPQSGSVARSIVLVSGPTLAVVVLVHALAQAVAAHSFATGHDLSGHAAEQALTQAPLLQAATYLGLLAGLALTAGMVIVALGASRVGLIMRWMLYLGMFAAVLAFTPFGDVFGFIQQLILAFWMVAIGLLFMRRLPLDPPAWASGEATPWPSPAEMRAQQTAEREGKGKGSGKDKRAGKGRGGDGGPENGEVAPEPAQRALGSSRRRRRKGSARQR